MKKKVGIIRSIWPDENKNLDIVEADLNKKECWYDACKGCTYVIHVASPVKQDKDPKMIPAAVEGTENVFRAAAESGVKKIVVTSSIAAVGFGHCPPATNLDNTVYSKEDNMNTEYDIYAKSKTLAEKRLWELYNGEYKGKIKATAINPGFIIGPAVTGECNFETARVIRDLMTKNEPAPNAQMSIVDVRDVALAHVKAIDLS